MSIKIIVCRNLGGECEQRLTAKSWREMVGVITRHIQANHPRTTIHIENMRRNNPKKWNTIMKQKWDALPIAESQII